MKCETCEMMKRIEASNEPACCIWYMDNVVCGAKSVEDCTAYQPPKSRIAKTYTFVSYDNYPHSLKKFHTFKKRFHSLSELAAFLYKSRLKVCLANPKDEISCSEAVILNKKFWSLHR